MGKIIRLKPELIEKIAAGEVVERPASVVKECIENSIDAGATRIYVSLRKGGKEEIIVEDNGTGMSREDLLLSVERHTTSKLRELRDLFNISQLGFRGEALASIAAVARLSIASNDSETSNEGAIVEVEDGRKEIKTAVMPRGTRVIVRGLFYNTPARLKFLSSDIGELKHALDIVTRYALAHPEIAFKIEHNGSVLLNAPIAATLKDRVAAVYGVDIAKNTREVKHEGEVRVEGLIGIPSISRKTRDYQSFFVNGRWVKSQLLTNAFESAYKTLLFLESKPVCVLHIGLNPSEVDVNVHPTKTEVKFIDEGLVFTQLHMAVKQALESKELIRAMPEQKPLDVPSLKKREVSYSKQEWEPSTQSLLAKDSPRTETRFRVLGQVAKSYIVAEIPEGLLIVDQHAAAERINLERLEKKKWNERVQRLLEPLQVELKSGFAAVISEHLNELRAEGFDIEGFGDRGFIVRQVPLVLGEHISRQRVHELLDELAETLKRPRLEPRQEIINSLACKGAIKAGEELTLPEMERLLNEMFECGVGYYCAHGRPSVIRLTIKDLERMFKRG